MTRLYPLGTHICTAYDPNRPLYAPNAPHWPLPALIGPLFSCRFSFLPIDLRSRRVNPLRGYLIPSLTFVRTLYFLILRGASPPKDPPILGVAPPGPRLCSFLLPIGCYAPSCAGLRPGYWATPRRMLRILVFVGHYVSSSCPPCTIRPKAVRGRRPLRGTQSRWDYTPRAGSPKETRSDLHSYVGHLR